MKLHLKKWVKVVLGLIIICLIFKGLAMFEESEVKKCMDYGYSEAYCRSAK